MIESNVSDEEFIQDALAYLDLNQSVIGGEAIPGAAKDFMVEVIQAANRSGLDRNVAGSAMVAAAQSLSLSPSDRAARNARRDLAAALEMDAWGDDDLVDEQAANKRKADMVKDAARRVVRHALDDDQRLKLSRLIAAAKEIEGGGRLMNEALWLFSAAFRDCSRGFAWVDNAKLDLVDVLLREIGRPQGASA
ncbi:hypothetical protein [Reyranella sp.]|uniref:hypothetical protein n=1 Tax=Reyranella sp. TaxID=1929291 RepID=UPI00272F0CC3|nr:hypothetical protein [Reyranella sp.]MDP2374264.1 hypothetical protein [Reyranella sp.]